MKLDITFAAFSLPKQATGPVQNPGMGKKTLFLMGGAAENFGHVTMSPEVVTIE